MSTQDYDEVEKLFAGTWKCDRDENLDEFMTAAGKNLKIEIWRFFQA